MTNKCDLAAAGMARHLMRGDADYGGICQDGDENLGLEKLISPRNPERLGQSSQTAG